MKKQLIIIGIALSFVCVVLSGCDTTGDTASRQNTGIPVLEPNFLVSDYTVIDNCGSTYPASGTVWLNFTITNYGGRGTVIAYAQVYQGILNYQLCGNGTVYNQTQKSPVYTLNQDGKADVRFVFTGIDCTNGTGCYGYNYWIDT